MSLNTCLQTPTLKSSKLWISIPLFGGFSDGEEEFRQTIGFKAERLKIQAFCQTSQLKFVVSSNKIQALVRFVLKNSETKSFLKMKRKNQPVLCIMKKLRSTLPRRKRFQISPIICSSLSSIASGEIASTHLTKEVSFNSSRISVNKPKASLKKRGCEEISDAGVSEKFGGSELRRITRTYNREKEIERTKVKEEKRDVGDAEVEVSESSYVESCAGVVAGEGGLKLKIKTEKGTENEEEVGKFRRNLIGGYTYQF